MPQLEMAIREYISDAWGDSFYIKRKESGVLPLPWEFEGPQYTEGDVIRGGYGGGWFHPVTGYSFPVALRLANAVVALAAENDSRSLHRTLHFHRRQLEFAKRLNKMLFCWFAPEKRHHVLRHFYRLPESSILRFYALRTTRRDRARIFMGRPPQGMSYSAALLGKKAS